MEVGPEQEQGEQEGWVVVGAGNGGGSMGTARC